MKPIIPFALLGALLAVGAADAAVTNPVGYYEFNGVAGGNIIVPGLVNNSVFTGVLTGSGATTLTFAANSFAAAAFNEGAVYAKYYAEITSGPNTGTAIDITSNTTSVITLADNVTALGLVGTESVTIRPHQTLRGLFLSDEASLSAFSDTATFYETTGAATTYFFGAGGANPGWSSDFATADGNDRPVPPGTGFVLGLAGNLQLTITGEVKEGPTVIQVTGGVPNLIGPVNPLVGTSVPLANSVLGFTAMVDFSDTVTVYVPGPLTASTTYFHVTGTGVTSDFATATTDLLSYTTGTVFIPAVTGAFKLGSGVPDN